MWTLLGRPSHIDMYQIVELLPLGYQKNSILLKLDSGQGPNLSVESSLRREDPNLKLDSKTKYRVCLPYPSAPNKKDGGLKIVDTDEKLKTLNFNSMVPGEFKIYDSARKLKNEEVDLVNVQEMHQHYNYNDFGYLTFEILENVWYAFTYTHKISSESILFIPFRLSGVLNLKKPEYNYNLWVKGGKRYNLQKFLIKSPESEFENFDKFGIVRDSDPMGWDEDIKINTVDGWDSSDDDLAGSDGENSE